MTTLNELTIQQAAQGLRRKEFSVSELVSDCLDAIQTRDPELHAYLEVFGQDARDAARGADALLTDPEHLPPLFGIPLAIKDVILIQGKRCTAGSRILANYTASYDATVIQKLKSQGAIVLGKTNLDEFAMGSSTENSSFGPTRNPHDTERVPGGSSGGSAAAVAAHLCLGALGSDTGGSIRQPAAFCGIVGLKPTYGRVSRYGLVAMASSLDQIGPMTKTVADARLMLEAIQGHDPMDATTVPGDLAPTLHRLNVHEIPTGEAALRGLKIGVPTEYFSQGLDARVEQTIRTCMKKLEAAGASPIEIHLPHSSVALPTYYIVVPSEVSANLARFDGIRYGYSDPSARSLAEVYARSRAMGFGPEVKRRILVGTYALSAGYYDAYYLKAQKVRQRIHQDFELAFGSVDLILGPTTPTPAFRIGERVNDPLSMYLADIYTVSINLAGLPGLSLPAGWVEAEGKKLPVGLQLVAPWFQEENLLRVGEATETLLAER